MDSAEANLSCGGEKDPTKCMIKGYRPQGGVPFGYLERLSTRARENTVNMVTPGTGAALTDRALAAHVGPQSQYYGAPSTVAPGDSASVISGAVP